MLGQQEAAGGYVGHGQQGNGHIVRAVIGDGDGTQLVAGGDGGVYGLHAVHGALELIQLQILGQHRLGGVGRVDSHGGDLVAQRHRHLADQLILLQHRAGGKIVKAPVEQAGRLGEALHAGAALLGLDLLTAQHHTDEGAAAPDGGGHQTVSRRIGGAGLDALCAGVEIAGHAPVGDQGVGAVQLPLLFRHIGGGYGVGLGVDDGHEIVVLHGLPGDEIDIPRGGVMAGLGQAGGVGKMGVLAAQLLRPLVHLLHEGVHGAGHGLAQNVARFVGGDHQHTVEKLLHRQRFTHLDVGGTAVLHHALHGGLGGGDILIHAKLAAIHGLQHQQGAHDLGDAGHRQLLVHILIVQHRACLAVHQNGGLGMDVRVLQRQRLRGEKGAQQAGQ